MYSILCDVQHYVVGTKGKYDIRTFTIREQGSGTLVLGDMLSVNRIARMKRNIYNHFVYTLQATDATSQKRIKDAISAIDV